MKKINEKELHQIFEDLKQNKEKSFNELYEKYNKLIYCIAFSILKNKENSEDIVQIVFTKIYKLEKEKLPTSNEASWLYSLTKNEALNYIRKQKNDMSLDELDYIAYEDREFEKIIDKDTYNRMMEKLDKEEKEIVSLKILADMKFKDIAKLLNMPIGTVQWKYYTALHSLKLIIGNISIFILGITLFIANKQLTRQDNSAGIDMSEGNINSLGDAGEEIVNGSQSEESSSLDSAFEENIFQEEMINETLGPSAEENVQINNTDIGILTFLGIFLVFTIVFLVIFIKHQQNKKKKVSK